MIREQMAIELWYLGIPPAQRVAVKDKDALWQSFHPSTQQRYVTDAIKLVSLLCAEIGKMENPCNEALDLVRWQGWNLCKEQILNKLRGAE